MRTFEAVARHLSFTMAAADLALTQSAVSHQIRALEQHLGARLFDRHHRGIEMTPEGRTFLEGIRAGLDSILLASERIRNQHRIGVLTVASPAAFAIWRLVPRLERFAALYPEIEVRIATIDGREPDLLRDGIDVAVVKRPAKAGGAASSPRRGNQVDHPNSRSSASAPSHSISACFVSSAGLCSGAPALSSDGEQTGKTTSLSSGISSELRAAELSIDHRRPAERDA